MGVSGRTNHLMASGLRWLFGKFSRKTQDAAACSILGPKRRGWSKAERRTQDEGRNERLAQRRLRKERIGQIVDQINGGRARGIYDSRRGLAGGDYW